FSHIQFSSPGPSPPEISPLSLHDALPICVVQRLQQAGSEVWVTITTPDEARQVERIGADAIVVQGLEAGGHRASFSDEPGLSGRSEEHTSELQSRGHLVCRLLLEKKKKKQ